MTKMKSKKMTKSTFAIIIMAIAMVAMLAFGGTYAYFTATTTEKTNTFTTGTVQLAAGDFTITNSKVVPGDKLVDKAVTYTNSSDVPVYLFVKYTVAGVDEDDVDTYIKAEGLGEGWTDYTATQPGVYYKKGAAASETFATSIVLNPDLASNSHDDATGLSMGIEITMTIVARAVQQQAGGVDLTPEAAYTAAFGATAAQS